VSMTPIQKQAFNDLLETAIDEAQRALRPLFDTVNGSGVHHLPAAEQDLMHEIMFKLGMLRIAIIQGDEAADAVHRRWLDVQFVRRRAPLRGDPKTPP
jgi:hypothetical protein